MDYQLDDKDRSILEILQENGDYTTRQIAKKTSLPITTVHNRIQRLKSEKIIRKFTIEVDPEVLNKGCLVYVLVSVNLERMKELKKTQYDIIKDLKNVKYVERADVVAGGNEIILMVRVKDVQEFNQVLLSKIQTINCVKETKSLIAVNE